MYHRFILAGISMAVISACTGAEPTPVSADSAGASSAQADGSASTSGSNSTASGGTVNASGQTTSAGATGGETASSSNTSASTSSTGGATTGTSASGGATSTASGGGSTTNSNATGGAVVVSNAGGTTSAGGGKAATGGNPSNGGTANTGGSTSAGGTSSTGGTSSGTSETGCTRESLQAAVDSYLRAAESKDTAQMDLGTSVKYVENWASSTLGQGIWQTALKIDFGRSLLDVDTCETFSEVIVTDNSHPYVIGTRLTVKDGKITEINSLVTDADDWLFDADAYLKNSKPENWGVLPADQRSERQTLIDAADAYWDYFTDKSADVPWGTPCVRLEGGPVTGFGANATCNIGIPEGNSNFSMFQQRHFVVDVEIGAVDGMAMMGNLPDSHLFRLESGKIRFIHTLTVCVDSNGTDNCANI